MRVKVRESSKSIVEAIRLAVRRLLVKGRSYHKLALYVMGETKFIPKGIKLFMNRLGSNKLDVGVFDLSRIFFVLSNAGYSEVRNVLFNLYKLQLENGLWIDYDVNLDFFRLLNDKGIALRMTLDVLMSVNKLGIPIDGKLKRAVDALFRARSPDGVWRRTFTRSKTWDVEITSKALLILNDYIDELMRVRTLDLISKWLSSCIITRSCDQPWALGWAIRVLYENNLLNEKQLNEAINMLIGLQSNSGYWGIFEENLELTFDNLMNLLAIKDHEKSLMNEISRIANVKARIVSVINELYSDMVDYLKEDLVNLTKRNTVRETNVFRNAFIWAVERSLFRKQDPRPLIELFSNYTEEYRPKTLYDHAYTIARYVLDKVAEVSNRHVALGWLLRYFKLNLWRSAPLLVIEKAIAAFPNSNQKLCDTYMFALSIALNIPKEHIRKIPCPVDRNLIEILRKLGLITTPIMIAIKNYNKVRDEVQMLAKELFPNSPFKLYALSMIPRRWCRGPTPCVKPSRKGYVLCPFHDLCPYFKGDSIGVN